MDPLPRPRVEGSSDGAVPSGEHPEVPHTAVHGLVRRFLEPTQDALVVVLSLLLFGVMVRALSRLGADVLAPGLTVHAVVAEALFVFVLLELQRLLILYLRDHHVSVDVMIEVTIVSVLREVLLLSAVEIAPLRLLAITGLVLALGLLLRFGDLRASRRRVRHHGASPPRRGARRAGRSVTTGR